MRWACMVIFSVVALGNIAAAVESAQWALRQTEVSTLNALIIPGSFVAYALACAAMAMMFSRAK